MNSEYEHPENSGETGQSDFRTDSMQTNTEPNQTVSGYAPMAEQAPNQTGTAPTYGQTAQEPFYAAGRNDGYEGQSADPAYYKENIRRLREEYKRTQQAEKERLRAEKAGRRQDGAAPIKGPSTAKAVAAAVVCSFLVFALVLTLLSVLPSRDHNYLARLLGVSNTGYRVQSLIPDQDDQNVDGTTVKPGDNVTIEVNGGSVAKAVYAKAAPSVVGIKVVYTSGSKWNPVITTVGMGSGIVYSEDGVIVTNFHVVEDAIDPAIGGLASNYSVQVYFKTDLSEYYTVTQLLGYHQESDVAVLQVNAKGLKPITFADSDEITVGESAVAIGSPGGLDFMNSVSEGIISGVDRVVTTETGNVYDLLQTTAAINPGNSGGALLNQEGELIGMCVIKLVSTGYEGMGFAINSNTIKRIVSAICEDGKYVKPLLGVTVDTTYNVNAANDRGWPLGAYVDSVSNGSCAAKAGLRGGDIIVAIAGTDITNFTGLRRVLMNYKPGDTVSLQVFRSSSGDTFEAEVVLDGE